MKSSELTLRVYYADTDAGGVVYHANYLNFCERARTEMLRGMGYELGVIAKERGLLFVVRRLEADYLAPSRLDDLLVIRSVTEEIKNSSFSMKQEVFRGDTLLFSMTVWLVCINLEARPVRVPEDLKAALQ